MVKNYKFIPLLNEYLRTGMKDHDKAWEKARNQAGLPDLRLHDLRRTCGYRLRQNGFSLDAIQAQLRHSDRRTTEKVYAPPRIELARSLYL